MLPRSLVVCSVPVLVILVLPSVPVELSLSRTLASEPFDRRPVGQEAMPPESEWVELSPEERLEALELLAEQTKGNYERIRTWQGVYRGRQIGLMPRDYVATFGEDVDADDVADLIREIDFDLTFAIDIASGAIYRERKRDTRYRKQGTDELVTLRNVKTAFEMRSVATAEHYVHFYPEEVWTGFSAVAEHHDAQQKRAAFRDPIEKAKKKESAELMNPCDFFGFDYLTKFWEGLDLYIRALRGETTQEEKRLASEMMVVSKAIHNGEPWYRLKSKLSNFYSNSVWSAAAGFNPVHYVLSKDEAGTEIVKMLSWQWAQADGIYVPAMVSRTMQNDEGILTYQRDVELTECVLNAPLDEHQFDYQGLGLKDGELVMDRIEEVCYIMRDGQPVKLAAFGEQYVPPGEAELRASSTRWLFLGGNVVLIALIVALIWRKRIGRGWAS